MKKQIKRIKYLLITILALMLFQPIGFSQNRADTLLANNNEKLKGRVAETDAYVNHIDSNKKLVYSTISDGKEYVGIYRTVTYRDSRSGLTLKTSRITRPQILNLSYYLNNQIICSKDISSDINGYSKVVTKYFDEEKTIFSTTNLFKETILKITYWYNGAEWSPSFRVDVTKDSIRLISNKKANIKIPIGYWDNLIKSINLNDFDNIISGSYRPEIDNTGTGYIITTNRRIHSIVNARNTSELEKNQNFLDQVNKLPLLIYAKHK